MGVRSEIIRLSLQDAGVASGLNRDAAAAMTLAQALDHLDGRGVNLQRTMPATARSIDDVGKSARTNDASINQLTGRLRLMADAAAILGPTIAPLGAAGVAGIGGLAGLLGAATAGGIGLAVAMTGVADAFTAVEKARLEPTVENIAEAERLMDRLAPQTQEFVSRLSEALPYLRELRNIGGEGLFTGLNSAVDDLDRIESVAINFMRNVGQAGGDAIADSAESLTSERWRPFLEFLSQEAPQAITNLTGILGSFAHAGAEMWMTFDPTNDKFVDWLGDVASGLDDWASSAEGQEDLRALLEYAEETGPKVADFAVSTANAIAQITQAAAPLGGPTLEALTTLMDAVGAIADSDLGTPLIAGASALALYNRTLQVTAALQRQVGTTGVLGGLVAGAGRQRSSITGITGDLRSMSTEFGRAGRAQSLFLSGMSRTSGPSQRVAKALGDTARVAGRAGTALGALAALSTGAADSMNLTNTATLGLLHPLGLLPGYLLDVRSSMGDLDGAMEDANLAAASGDIDEMKIALANLDAQMLATKESLTTSGLSDFFSDQLDPAAVGARFEAGWAWATGNASPLNQAAADMKNLEAAMNGQGFGIAAGVLEQMNTVTYKLRAGVKLTAAEIRGLNEAMLENRAAAIGAFDAVTQYREALKAARAQGEKNNAGIEGNSKAALENRGIISDLATAWNNQSAAVRNNVGKYREARQSFLEVATAMGVPIKRAVRLADALIALPRKTNIELQAQDRATAKITAVQRLVDYYGLTKASAQALLKDLASGKVTSVQRLINKYGLTKAEAQALLNDAATGKLQGLLGLLSRTNGQEAHTYVYTHLRTVRDGNDTAGGPPALRGADGMTVPGPRYPYGDKVYAFLAPGEEVISNRSGQADRFRADRAAGRIPSYADGGEVGFQTVVTHPRTDPLARESRETGQALKKLRAELKEATAAVEKERRQRDALLDKMRSVASDVSGGLRSDLFGDTDPWASQYGGTSPQGVMGTLRGDLQEARALRQAIKELKAKGLTGGALAEVLRAGGLEGAQAFAELSRTELKAYARLYNERNRVLTSVGNLAGDASYGAQERGERKELRAAVTELKQIKAQLKRNGKDDRDDHKRGRDAQQRGARRGARSRRRS